MQLMYSALPTVFVESWRNGARDVYGNAPERHLSDGSYQCRHCLHVPPGGTEMLLVAHRPFDRLDAYAETGPLFVCADPCERYRDETVQPPSLCASPDYLLKGYGTDDRIVYGTGRVVPVFEVESYARETLSRSDVRYIHVRSARNNCYQARIDRA